MQTYKNSSAKMVIVKNIGCRTRKKIVENLFTHTVKAIHVKTVKILATTSFRIYLPYNKKLTKMYYTSTS